MCKLEIASKDMKIDVKDKKLADKKFIDELF